MLLHVQDHDVYCYTGGRAFNPELPTVVFIHGALNDHSVWLLQSRYFAHRGSGVLAVDLPGHGRSKGAALTSIEAMSSWLLALLDAADVQQAMLVGHSMGSLIALETCARAPQRIAKLALVGTAWPMAVSSALLDSARDDEQAAIDTVAIWSHGSLAYDPSRPARRLNALSRSRRLMQRLAAKNPGHLLYTDLAACNAYANGEAAASVHCPTLFLLAKRDRMTPLRASATLIKAMPQAQVVEIDNCGHALMADQPHAVRDALFAFANAAG